MSIKVTPETEEKQTLSLKMLYEKITALEEQNKLLTLASDKNRMAALAPKHNPDNRSIRLNIFNGKVVTSWDNLKTNEVHVNSTTDGRLIRTETQIGNIHLEDGTNHESPYLELVRAIKPTEQLDVLSIVQKAGKTYYTVEYNGTQYTVEATFANTY